MDSSPTSSHMREAGLHGEHSVPSRKRVSTAVRRGARLVLRGWLLGRTRLLWSWRFGRLGRRTVICRPLRVENPRAIHVGSYVTIMDGFQLAAGNGPNPRLIIGDGTRILYRFQCNALESVIIGRDVLLASNVLVTDSDHIVEPGGLPATKNGRFVSRPVRIGDNCWIGQNAAILKGVTIGHDCIVGANSVVTHDMPDCSVGVGNPARIIKTLEYGRRG